MSELRINGHRQIQDILRDLLPLIRFKKIQAETIMLAMNVLIETRSSELSREDRKKLVRYILTIQNSNYVTKRKRTRKELMKVLGLTP
jgi:hypothetical protein